MAQDVMDLSNEGAALPTDMSPSDSMLNNLKNGASFVCLYHNGNTKDSWSKRQGCTNRRQSG
jgi:hypothetical protein